MPAQNKLNAIFVDFWSPIAPGIFCLTAFMPVYYGFWLFCFYGFWFFACVSSCVFIMFFSFPFFIMVYLPVYSFSKDRKSMEVGWQGGSRKRENCDQNILYENILSIKHLCMSGYECYLACIKSGSRPQHWTKSSTEDLEGEGSEVQDHPWLHREFEVCAILYLKVKRIYVCPPCKFYHKEWSISNAVLTIWILKCLQSKVYLCL